MSQTLDVTVLPDQLAAGMQVTYLPDVNKNTSEGGNSGRNVMRPPIRNYTVTVSPDISDEIQAIVMATYVTRYPLIFKDPTACTFTESPATVAADGLTAKINRAWTPATGPLQFLERVLYIDPSVAITVLVNGVSASPTLGNYGIITFSGAISPSAEVLVTGKYYQTVCILDPPSANVFGRTSNGTIQYQFATMRLEQIFETEFIRLTS